MSSAPRGVKLPRTVRKIPPWGGALRPQRCGDGTLYTGMTDDPERRLAAHRSGHGAKYTRGRGPLELVYSEACGTRGDALRREAAIKRLPRAKKLRLIKEVL